MNSEPDPGIFEIGRSPLAVIYTALLIFSFLMKLYEIIEPRVLEKRGFQSPESSSGSGLGI